MNYKKVIKDLKERNDKLQEQYRLRDIRCIHLEYENEMLKGDFEAQHELTKKYAKENKELKEELEKEYNKGYERGILDTVEENQRLDKENRELKEQLHEASIEMQEMIEQDIECHSNCSKLKDLDKIEKSFIEIKNQQKEFIEYTNKTIVELECIDTFKEILSKYREIIGGKE